MIDFLLDIILTVAFFIGMVTAAAFIGLLILIAIELTRRD